MIKLKNIAESIIKEGGKLFGVRAERVSTDEMNAVFNEVNRVLKHNFDKMELSRALKTKMDHGDIDIVVLNQSKLSMMDVIKKSFGDRIEDSSKNGNIYSVLYRSPAIGKTVHIDFLTSPSPEAFDSQWEYLSYNDFSGILGVFARRMKFIYGTQGFFKIYIDKRGTYHHVFITNDLRKGLKILGYTDIKKYDDISSVDDIVSFIIDSPLFASEDYVGQTMNHSDRKRVRAGRPTADYIRNKLISLNISRKVTDEDFFFKTLFPSDYDKYLKKCVEIESVVIPKSKYNGGWLMTNFPEVKPGPFVGKVLKFWFDTYGDKLDGVSEDELKRLTKDFLNKNT